MFGIDFEKLQKDMQADLAKLASLQTSIETMNLLIPELVTQLKRLNDNLEKK